MRRSLSVAVIFVILLSLLSGAMRTAIHLELHRVVMASITAKTSLNTCERLALSEGESAPRNEITEGTASAERKDARSAAILRLMGVWLQAMEPRECIGVRCQSVMRISISHSDVDMSCCWIKKTQTTG